MNSQKHHANEQKTNNIRVSFYHCAAAKHHYFIGYFHYWNWKEILSFFLRYTRNNIHSIKSSRIESSRVDWTFLYSKAFFAKPVILITVSYQIQTTILLTQSSRIEIDWGAGRVCGVDVSIFVTVWQSHRQYLANAINNINSNNERKTQSDSLHNLFARNKNTFPIRHAREKGYKSNHLEFIVNTSWGVLMILHRRHNHAYAQW